MNNSCVLCLLLFVSKHDALPNGTCSLFVKRPGLSFISFACAKAYLLHYSPLFLSVRILSLRVVRSFYYAWSTHSIRRGTLV